MDGLTFSGTGDGVFAAFARPDGPDGSALDLLVENLHCPGCIARIEGAFDGLADVTEARVNLTARRLRLRWRGGAARADELVRKVQALGYEIVPYRVQEAGGGRDETGRLLLRSLAVAGFAAANIMLLSVSVWAGAASDMGPATRALMHYLSALIALPAVAYAGRPFFESAVAALRHGALNMDVPISLAVLLATGMSLFETVRGGPHAYFDAAVMLLFFLLVGRYLDHLARARARSAAERLAVLGGAVAHVVTGDGTRPVPADLLQPGVLIAVAAGERIPADGVVAHGLSDVDTSLVTGETAPKPVGSGDRVLAGTVNLTGALQVRVAAAGEETVLAEIARLTEAAEQQRSRYVRLADRAARFYAPAVHLAALATFLGWLALGGLAWQPALLIAVSVLIITCPCALGLAVPVVQVIASGRLMQGGVLVKQGDALERLASVDTVVFDKTGTLTTGALRPVNLADIAPEDAALVGRVAAASRHPLCLALAEALGDPVPAAGVREHPGEGLAAEIAGETVRLGSRAWCGAAGQAADWRAGPELWLARGGALPVRIAFTDAVRGDAAATVAALRTAGLAVELLSGDGPLAVEAAARAAGIDAWRALQTPAAKVARLQELAASGRRVLMVGDGLNDAPALSAALVSMSPSDAADISRTAADFVFQGAALAPVPHALHVARAAKRLAMQNFALAALYNAVAVPFAMAGLVTPLIAALAMSGSSLAVTLNALRLRLGRWAGAS